jgi:hypothetical protein
MPPTLKKRESDASIRDSTRRTLTAQLSSGSMHCRGANNRPQDPREKICGRAELESLRFLSARSNSVAEDVDHHADDEDRRSVIACNSAIATLSLFLRGPSGSVSTFSASNLASTRRFLVSSDGCPATGGSGALCAMQTSGMKPLRDVKRLKGYRDFGQLATNGTKSGKNKMPATLDGRALASGVTTG